MSCIILSDFNLSQLNLSPNNLSDEIMFVGRKIEMIPYVSI